MAMYCEHDLIKMINLAKILDHDPYYSATENRDRVFFVDDLIPTICSSTEMIHRWEAHGLVPADNNNVDILTTRKYSIKIFQTFLEKHNFPLPGALFPDSKNNTSRAYFNPLAAKYFGTERQEWFEQKRQRNELLNKFFYNSEIVHREDYYQFETTPISQPEESDRIRVDALNEVQSVWLELKHNKFIDELQIIQEWIDGYISKKTYLGGWKIIKELSEIDASIKEYESTTPANITEISIRNKALAELRERKSRLQASACTTNKVANVQQCRQASPVEDASAPVAVVQDVPVVEVAPATAVADKTDIGGEEGLKRKTPAELLAMHEKDPDTWTQLTLAQKFYDGTGDKTNENTLRGWTKKQWSKARKERAGAGRK